MVKPDANNKEVVLGITHVSISTTTLASVCVTVGIVIMAVCCVKGKHSKHNRNSYKINHVNTEHGDVEATQQYIYAEPFRKKRNSDGNGHSEQLAQHEYSVAMDPKIEPNINHIVLKSEHTASMGEYDVTVPSARLSGGQRKAARAQPAQSYDHIQSANNGVVLVDGPTIDGQSTEVYVPDTNQQRTTSGPGVPPIRHSQTAGLQQSETPVVAADDTVHAIHGVTRTRSDPLSNEISKHTSSESSQDDYSITVTTGQEEEYGMPSNTEDDTYENMQEMFSQTALTSGNLAETELLYENYTSPWYPEENDGPTIDGQSTEVYVPDTNQQGTTSGPGVPPSRHTQTAGLQPSETPVVAADDTGMYVNKAAIQLAIHGVTRTRSDPLSNEISKHTSSASSQDDYSITVTTGQEEEDGMPNNTDDYEIMQEMSPQTALTSGNLAETELLYENYTSPWYLEENGMLYENETSIHVQAGTQYENTGGTLREEVEEVYVNFVKE